MPEEVASNIYRIEVPLPDSPLKAVNCYLIKSPDRNLLVDTGMNREECRAVLEPALEHLGVGLAETDFFITHLHADHIGLVSRLSRKNSTIYFNRPEAEIISKLEEEGGLASYVSKLGRLAGLSQVELEDALSQHPAFRYYMRTTPRFTIVEDGDPLPIGEYRFRCIQTPGHSPGHLCLFDVEKKLMLCGDHVLDEITPNISAWSADDSPLTDYLASLDKVYGLEVATALPGHRRIITDFRGRVNELKQHHMLRLEEIRRILEAKHLDAYSVASKMTWNLKNKGWGQASMIQKWFASGEALAHLLHLEREQRVERKMEDGRLVFSTI